MPKIRPGYNPAAWMLEVTSSAEENRLGVDFAEIYRRSNLCQCVHFLEIIVIGFASGRLHLFFLYSFPSILFCYLFLVSGVI